MSRAIICFAIVVVLSSIGNGRVIDKRSPQGYIYILGLLLIYQTYLYNPWSPKICSQKMGLQPHQYLMSFTAYSPLLVWWAGGVAPLVHWALGFSVSSVQNL